VVPPEAVAVKVTAAPTAGAVLLADRLRVKAVVPTLIMTKADPVEFPDESNTSTLAG
jgi:hypothetical protein